MSKDDWFRNKEWNSAVAEQFEAKLRRARSKSQYLRIQALYLADTYPTEALALLDRYFLLGDDFDFAQAYVDQSKAYIALHDQDAAIRALHLALKREEVFPNLKTQAWREYALLIAVHKRKNLYTDALAVLERNSPDTVFFPADKFCWFAAFALIYEALNDTDKAKEAANTALHWAGVTHSGFRYHPNVGLVEEKFDSIKASLREITG